MNKFNRLWHESAVYNFVMILTDRLYPMLKNALFSSFLWKIWILFNDKVVGSRIVQYFLDPKYITDAWYSSEFYRSGTHGLRNLSSVLPEATPRWSIHYIGIYLILLLALPELSQASPFAASMFSLLALFYVSHHLRYRTGTVFMLITIMLFVFWGALSLAVPKKAAELLFYLVMGIDFFFLISSAVRTEDELNVITGYIFSALVCICAFGFIQQTLTGGSAHATFQNGAVFGGIIILLFPFAFIFPMKYKSGLRRPIYLIILLPLVFTAVTATRSKAALIGFSAEVLLLMLMINPRYLPLLLFLAPALTTTVLENIAAMWRTPAIYGNFFENIYYRFKNFWLNGFGINRTEIMNLYSSAAEQAAAAELAALHISPMYYALVPEIGTLFLIIFLGYLLRLAHSTLTAVFTAQKKFKPYFAAGFATLVGISVSSIVDSALLNFETLFIYWGILGLLRTLKIIRFGIER